jgi:protein-tyrosine phosphatase
VESSEYFADIHCHLLPGVDDGAKSWDDALEMASIAYADGIRAVIATPHQLGAYAHNTADMIRSKTAELLRQLQSRGIELQLLPGADVRIEPEIVPQLVRGEVLTLADHHRHVLLELPHDLYFPLEKLVDRLQQQGIVAILSHPERNQGLLRQRQRLHGLVERGCLMQITAGSITGSFGHVCQQMADWMLAHQLVHFIATDAHGPHARRPLMRRAFTCVSEKYGLHLARILCAENPRAVCDGRQVECQSPVVPSQGLGAWFGWRKAA